MGKAQYSIIKNRKQYHEYCSRHEQINFIGNHSKAAKDEMELLEFLIGKWDREHNIFGEEETDPIALLKFIMAEHKMQARDLAELLSVGKSLVSEILNYKKGLSKENIRTLAERFKVRQEAFNKPYELQKAPATQLVRAPKVLTHSILGISAKGAGVLVKGGKTDKPMARVSQAKEGNKNGTQQIICAHGKSVWRKSHTPA